MAITVTGLVGDISGALRHSAKDKNLNRDQRSFEYYNLVSDAGTAVTLSDVWMRKRRRGDDDRQRG